MHIAPKLLTILALLLTFADINGQDAQKLKFGLMAGTNLSWIKSRSPELDGRGIKPGFQYGLFADFAFKGNPNYYFSSGIIFRHQYLPLSYNAAEYVSNVAFASEREGRISANYLFIPTALKMRTDEIGYSVWSGLFGISTGIRLRGEEQYQATLITGNQRRDAGSFERDVSDQLKAIVLSFDIGVEWERKISGNTFFTLGIQFNNGITNLLNMRAWSQLPGGATDLGLVLPNGNGQGNFLKANTRTLSINVGVYF
jgi:hypothetical protein